MNLHFFFFQNLEGVQTRVKGFAESLQDNLDLVGWYKLIMHVNNKNPGRTHNDIK